eukprot:15111863-Alexandrium_andersonii.AAC.1
MDRRAVRWPAGTSATVRRRALRAAALERLRTAAAAMPPSSVAAVEAPEVAATAAAAVGHMALRRLAAQAPEAYVVVPPAVAGT